MSEPSLKPCPFCGSTPEVYPDGGEEGHTIMCSGPYTLFGGKAEQCPLRVTGYATHEAAVEAWNRRAQPEPAAHPELPAITEAMVTAYLEANDRYWKEVDALPKHPAKWRDGTPREATRVSLIAALAARQVEPHWANMGHVGRAHGGAAPRAATPTPTQADAREQEIFLAVTRAGFTLVQSGEKFRLERYHEIKPQTPGQQQGAVWRSELPAQADAADAIHALRLAEGALMMVQPCAEPECKAEQQDWIDTALAAVRAAMSTPPAQESGDSIG